MESLMPKLRASAEGKMMRARRQIAAGYRLFSMHRFCCAVFAAPQMMLHERH